MCDGMSLLEHGIILYKPTREDSRRENFTLLHEFAHLLITGDDEALNWLADRDEPAMEEERLCDQIAALLLVPDELLDAVVGAGPVRAQHLLDLFTRSEASQVVCAIALSRRLACAGAIMLVDRATQTVAHVSLVDPPVVHPRRNQVLPDAHPLRRIQAGQHLGVESFWATPWGDRRRYYLDATATARRAYAVLADIDLWNVATLHLGDPKEPTHEPPRFEFSCGCGFSGRTSGYPCSDCGKPYCPSCKKCECDRYAARSATCSGCFLTVPQIDLVEGRCSACR